MKAARLLIAAVTVAVVSGALLTGCTADEQPRTVTTDEAQLLAVTRFQNFDTGTRPFESEVVIEGSDLNLQGWVDYATHIGYASVTGQGFDAQSVLWTEDTVGLIAASPDADGNPPLPVPAADDPEWTSRALDPSASRLDALLAVIGGLGSDRPENPLLLQQTGALWLRTDEVNGTAVTVFAAPPSDEVATAPVTPDDAALRLWVDAEGLLRVAEARVGTDWVRIDFSDAPGPALQLPASDE